MSGIEILDSLAIFGAKYLYIILLAVAAIWYLRQSRSSQVEMIAWGAVALPLMFILLLIAGWSYFDPRPFVSDHIVPLIPHDPDNGFPSDHTLLCSAVASIVFFYNTKFSALLWVLTALVGASRVYTGVHHTLDIITSMLLAVTVSVLVWKFILPLVKRSPVYVW